jgi:molecular chaperone HtpG
VRRLEGLPDEEFGELSRLLYDQAQLTEQGHVANPGEYAQRLNRLLLKLLK